MVNYCLNALVLIKNSIPVHQLKIPSVIITNDDTFLNIYNKHTLYYVKSVINKRLRGLRYYLYLYKES